MAVRTINTVAYETELKILKTPAIRNPDISAAVILAVDLLETTLAHQPDCVGLAANQIWKPTETETTIPHVFVAKIGGSFRTFINSTTKRSGQYFRHHEGCMSKPTEHSVVVRRESITIKYIDVDGTARKENFHGIDAVIIQHEVDHLTGQLI